MPEPRRSTIDAGEVERFSALAAEWWNPNGKFRPLHKFNPVRLSYIRDQVAARFGRDPRAARPFEGLRFLDLPTMRAMFQFPPDMAHVTTAIQRLDDQPLVRYFDEEWGDYLIY